MNPLAGLSDSLLRGLGRSQVPPNPLNELIVEYSRADAAGKKRIRALIQKLDPRVAKGLAALKPTGPVPREAHVATTGAYKGMERGRGFPDPLVNMGKPSTVARDVPPEHKTALKHLKPPPSSSARGDFERRPVGSVGKTPITPKDLFPDTAKGPVTPRDPAFGMIATQMNQPLKKGSAADKGLRRVMIMVKGLAGVEGAETPEMTGGYPKKDLEDLTRKFWSDKELARLGGMESPQAQRKYFFQKVAQGRGKEPWSSLMAGNLRGPLVREGAAGSLGSTLLEGATANENRTDFETMTRKEVGSRFVRGQSVAKRSAVPVRYTEGELENIARSRLTDDFHSEVGSKKFRQSANAMKKQLASLKKWARSQHPEESVSADDIEATLRKTKLKDLYKGLDVPSGYRRAFSSAGADKGWHAIQVLEYKIKELNKQIPESPTFTRKQLQAEVARMGTVMKAPSELGGKDIPVGTLKDRVELGKKGLNLRGGQRLAGSSRILKGVGRLGGSVLSILLLLGMLREGMRNRDA